MSSKRKYLNQDAEEVANKPGYHGKNVREALYELGEARVCVGVCAHVCVYLGQRVNDM